MPNDTPARGKRTAEQACVDYSIASGAVRRYTSNIRKALCIRMSDTCPDGDWGSGTGPDIKTCLDEFFHAPKGPDGEFPRYREFHEKMCSGCKTRLDLINLRSAARVHLGACKRSVVAIGKRLHKPND